MKRDQREKLLSSSCWTHRNKIATLSAVLSLIALVRTF